MTTGGGGRDYEEQNDEEANLGRLKRSGESEGENGGRGWGGRKRKGENELALRPNGNKSKWWDANCLGVFQKKRKKEAL